MKFDDGGDHGRVGTYTVAEMFSKQAQAAPSLAAQRCSGKGQVVVWDMGLVVAMVHCCLELGMVEGYQWKDIDPVRGVGGGGGLNCGGSWFANGAGQCSLDDAPNIVRKNVLPLSLLLGRAGLGLRGARGIFSAKSVYA